MNAIQITEQILDELGATLAAVDPRQTDAVVDAILSAGRIFVAAAGRSMLMLRGMAMRLMHMGFDVYVVGETVTPAIGSGDLLIIASGSGETATLRVFAEKAKQVGARLALMTINPDSSIGKAADHVIQIDAATTKGNYTGRSSVQPGANTFEQSVLLLGDAMVIQIINLRGIDHANEALMRRHANLE